MDTVLDGGFTAPVLQSQTVFRAAMDALANPGTAQNLVASRSMASHWGAELVSIVLTLSDHDTPIWLSPRLATDASVREFINFHTGAPIVTDMAKAVFAFAAHVDELPPIGQFNLGTQEYPDRSTTIVLAVEGLSGGDALTTVGPGIKDHGHIAPVGLPADFIDQWAVNRELFPRGIDLLLVADGQVMGLPRSTRISKGH